MDDFEKGLRSGLRRLVEDEHPPLPRGFGDGRVRPGWTRRATIAIAIAASIVVGTVALASVRSNERDEGRGISAAAENATSSTTVTPTPVGIFAEPFSGPNRGWPSDARYRFVDGGYEGVLADRRPQGATARAPVPVSLIPQDVRVSVKVTKTSLTSGGSFGLMCREHEGRRYGARIFDEGNFVITKVVDPVASGTALGTGKAAVRAGEQNEVALVCAGQSPVTLTLFVNGVWAGQSTDEQGYPVGTVGIDLAAETPGVRALFDDFVITAA